MKRIVVLALVLNAALLGVIAHQLVAIAGGGAVPTADQNGDVNGDARLDMSDAIYLLLHIFRDGPGPVALADSPEVLERLDTLEATQGALQQGLTDLPELLNDNILYATDLTGGGVFEWNGETCARTYPADVAWFETNGVLRGGVLSEENGRIYFSTSHESDLLVEAFMERTGASCVSNTWEIRISDEGGGSIGTIHPSQWRGGDGTRRIQPIVLNNIPPGRYYLEFAPRVRVVGVATGCGRCDDNQSRPMEYRMSTPIHWISIKHLR